MIKLLYTYIGILSEKVVLVKEYGAIINTAYVLQAGTIGADHENQKSPIATNFLVKLTRLWDKY